ncbi:Hypothetical protein P9211_11051 [Prochlorococcus marinus str. MIT 9211]|uniref:HTH cro/C1-type domain-containing protein n=2 Tax=Prochlorococcus marinus TaxID=1219 RepID=A9BB24_PROM4|nr:Hypothetical protein P9211_11051 [Prochlorococcus marinus str. MIT 9211]
MLKEKREQRGLSRTDLSSQTRISVAVIQAIENGWLNQLPEKAYLSKMLLILEDQLGLKRNSLKIFCEEESKSDKSLRLFTLGNINIFSSWQGSFIYFLLIGLSIFMINKQQEYLSIKNSQTTAPIIIK